MTEQLVWSFRENNKSLEESVLLLGNKGAQLVEMTRIGLPVPPAFTISTNACRSYLSNKKKWPADLEKQVKQKIVELEKEINRKLGDTENPLLVSVRSGSFISMPGMMETILNLGLNDATVKGLAQKTNNPRMAWDSYRRLIQMFGDVVLGIDSALFEGLLTKAKQKKGTEFDTELEEGDLKELVLHYKKLVKEKTKKEFPQDIWEQLRLAINAVFDSWNADRAIAYRRIHNLQEGAGTGVTIQAMVFGNKGEHSATGVAFSRNPSTGEKGLYGEFLVNAQGEDVVAGVRTPQPIVELEKFNLELFERLKRIAVLLEKHYKEMQDFEFTIENGKLFLLQTRTGKRTAQAAIKIAIDMVKEKLISKEEAVLQIDANQLNHVLHKQLKPAAKKSAQLLATGLAASPGAAIGKVVFSAQEALHESEKDPSTPLILVRPETSPEDIEGISIAKGILTSTGGLTSHAAVVARGMGKPCVSGCDAIVINEENGSFFVQSNGDSVTVKAGEWLSLDGGMGEVFLGKLDVEAPSLSGDFATLMDWADFFRKLEVRTNADTPKDASVAKNFGAEGIGLCRTEHMFFDKDRLPIMRQMIMADSPEKRKKALEKLLPFQRKDFEGLFEVMNGLPVTIRLLDPPLHEFLPKTKEEMQALASEMNVSIEFVRKINNSLKEFNPMLGFRGCRLGVVFPEITKMQIRAVFEAALNAQRNGIKATPEIEIPLVAFEKEFDIILELVKKIALKLDPKESVDYKIGCMIEVPRSALIADKLAKKSDFFSFGTNDLTQTTLGFSRDDTGKFIAAYKDKKVFDWDPFVSIDEIGVGALMQIAVEKARESNPEIEIGICGEHGGDPRSVEFCHKLGLDNVSCSPYRVPIARLAAAQAAIKEKLA
ncbi:pyruvate, phosphate dikinase [Candidatus Micrarchaeota archaeon]|nr:pyruvate, phosphate dikinase [Candidatus Micrarchaeota archaeon]MBU1930250.1 pyruvate, phosphate dikinase [Candidatus Micrarchaeota archaeon]